MDRGGRHARGGIRVHVTVAEDRASQGASHLGATLGYNGSGTGQGSDAAVSVLERCDVDCILVQGFGDGW